MFVGDRFWSKVKKTDGCWMWTGGYFAAGYGAFSDGGRLLKAHRFAYEWERGPIPDGLHLDHLCRNRACVNPDHLEPVTCRENILRGIGLAAKNAVKTHCKRGHDLSTHASLVRGQRICRICGREKVRLHRLKRKLAVLLHGIEIEEV